MTTTREDVLKKHAQLVDDIEGNPDSEDAVCVSTCIECGAVFVREDAIDVHGQDYEHFTLRDPEDGYCDKPAA